MLRVQRPVTLCLLITYHWLGSAGSPATAATGLPTAGVGLAGGAASAAAAAAAAATAGIAAEVNGSPTDARLNIPVVKRSSNQAGFANELRPNDQPGVNPLPEVAAPTLFELPHEYVNRNGEKYTTESSSEKGQGFDDEPTGDRKKTRPEPESAEKDEVEERGELARGIKSSILAQDGRFPLEPGLIGKPNYSSLAQSSYRPRFHYERASAAAAAAASELLFREQIEEEEERTSAEGTTSSTVRDIPKNKAEKEANSREQPNNSTSDNTRSTMPIISREERALHDREEKKRLSVVGAGLDTIDNQIQKPRKENRNGDHDASRVYHRLSSSSPLKPMEHSLLFSESKLSSSNIPNSVTNLGKINKSVASRRLHQQSTNTKPGVTIQHLRRNMKRQTSPYDNNMFATNSNLRENRKIYGYSPKHSYADNRSSRQSHHQQIPTSFPLAGGPGPQLRFIPSNHLRNGNRIYFERNVKPFPSQVFHTSNGNNDNNDASSSFTPNNGITSHALRNLQRLDPSQIENLKKSLRGVFDKYETSEQDSRSDLPNVRTIRPNQIFVAQPKLIYDTKILPAPFPLSPFFQPTKENSEFNDNNDNDDNNNDNHRHQEIQSKFTINGVFDQTRQVPEESHKSVIPVREKSEPSLPNTRNFVTPLPTYRESQVSVRVNQPVQDPSVTDEIYQVSNVPRIPGYSLGELQRDAEYEDSRLNHESPNVGIEAGHHFGAVGSSNVNLESTSGGDSQEESGPTGVDRSPVIDGTDDEYVNFSPAINDDGPGIPTGEIDETATGSRDEIYDRGSYKWRGEYDNDHARYAAKYSFGYRVSDYNSQNEFGHHETRNEGITKGKYHVRLPDGRLQKVNYHVDDKGYHALVSYHVDRAD